MSFLPRHTFHHQWALTIAFHIQQEYFDASPSVESQEMRSPWVSPCPHLQSCLLSQSLQKSAGWDLPSEYGTKGCFDPVSRKLFSEVLTANSKQGENRPLPLESLFQNLLCNWEVSNVHLGLFPRRLDNFLLPQICHLETEASLPGSRGCVGIHMQQNIIWL